MPVGLPVCRWDERGARGPKTSPSPREGLPLRGQRFERPLLELYSPSADPYIMEGVPEFPPGLDIPLVAGRHARPAVPCCACCMLRRALAAD